MKIKIKNAQIISLKKKFKSLKLIHRFQALWYVVLSHTDFICYAMVFLNQVSIQLVSIKSIIY